MKTLEENNREIANFMGWREQTDPTEKWFGNWFDGNYRMDRLHFYLSWDSLMPVVGKISNSCEEPEELDELKYALLSNDIDTAYKFVLDYIKNY